MNAMSRCTWEKSRSYLSSTGDFQNPFTTWGLIYDCCDITDELALVSAYYCSDANAVYDYLPSIVLLEPMVLISFHRIRQNVMENMW